MKATVTIYLVCLLALLRIAHAAPQEQRPAATSLARPQGVAQPVDARGNLVGWCSSPYP